MSKGMSHALTWVGVIAILVIVAALILKAIELVIALVLLAVALPAAIVGVRALRKHGHHQVTDETRR